MAVLYFEEGKVNSMDPILFVALSKGMADMAAQASAELGMNIHIEVCSQKDVKDVVPNYPDIEVYISRGKTAEVLQQITGKTVMAVKPTIDEILKLVQDLSNSGINKVAIVADPKLIGKETHDFKINGAHILFRPCEMEGLDKLIRQLAQAGIEGIIGGRNAFSVAEKNGMKSEMLESGFISIKRAIEEAAIIAKSQKNERIKEMEKTEEIFQCSKVLYDAIEQAAAYVEEFATSSHELADTSHETADISRAVFKEVNNTSEILNIMRRVADQTNLLGLNASIEAARCGEYGRGFSVVAGEVRRLADESKKNAQKINTMLSNFHVSVKSVMENVEQENIIIQEQAKATQEMTRMLEKLREVGQKLIDMAKRGAN